MKGNNKLSFVLPVALRERGLSLNTSGSWRHSPDEGAIIRTRLLLASFVKHFRQEDVDEFVIVCPSEDIIALSDLVASVTCDTRYHVLSDIDICPDEELAVDPCTGEINGWYAQQLIKLAISHRISSEYYMTLDSDILCIKPTAFEFLFANGLALTNTEAPADYERIYTHDFAQRETAGKLARYQISREFLGYRRPRNLWHRFYGETPVILNTGRVVALTEYLESRFNQTWVRTLVSKPGWTEYSMYFQFLELQGQLDLFHSVAGCNAVLDLEKSVWQESRHYRTVRSYDVNHFGGGRQDSEGGPFVAIQSWLDVLSWLPRRCETVSDFYEEVDAWLFDRKNGKYL